MLKQQCTISKKVQKEALCQNLNTLTMQRTVQGTLISTSIIFIIFTNVKNMSRGRSLHSQEFSCTMQTFSVLIKIVYAYSLL